MILCVTLNPGLDKTLTVPAWGYGESTRGRSVRSVVGGKGINVARALKRLGRPMVRPVLFLGGPNGERSERLLRTQDGFDPLVSPIESETRELLTVRSDDPNGPLPTAFFDPDPIVTAEEAVDLVNRVEGAITVGGVRAIALCGSSPSIEADGVYADLVALAKVHGIPTYLDTYGPPLARLWGFWPDSIGLNRREAAIRLGLDRRPTDAEVGELLDSWSSHGVATCHVTDGPDAILCMIDGERFRVEVPQITPVNPTGSGDSLLAGLIDARLSGLDPIRTLQRAAACGVANALVWEAGAIDPGLVDRVAQEVQVSQA